MMQKCWEDDFAGSSNIYDGTGGAWRWTLGQQSPEETVGESGGTKLTFSLVQDLVISIPKAPCMYVTRDSKVLAKGACLLSHTAVSGYELVSVPWMDSDLQHICTVANYRTFDPIAAHSITPSGAGI